MLETMLSAALELTHGRPGPAVYQRLLAGVREVIPCDASSLMRLQGNALIPVAADGLLPSVVGRRFALDKHPRLKAIASGDACTRFSAEDPRPDPFDGLIEGVPPGTLHVHSCMGCALRVEGELVGVLTVDALKAHSFDDVCDDAVGMFAALAAATLRLAHVMDQLHRDLDRCRSVSQIMMEEVRNREGELIGDSAVMRALDRELTAVAESGLPALIQGETGTGKELVARTIHGRSRRADRPLVYVNCAALPETLAETEFFGHVRGAFTGATANRAGKFELAHQGTIFLDEIGELSLAIQPKLLRALQEGELQRIGTDRVRRVDVRIIAATNRDLLSEVEAGRFRADLYHRLSVYPVRVPPLRERLDDIPLLAEHFLRLGARQVGISKVGFVDAVAARMARYAWPGNVRELQHVVLRGLIRARQSAGNGVVALGPEHLDLDRPGCAEPFRAPVAPTPHDEQLPDFHVAVNAYQRALIQSAVDSSQGNWSAAARALSLDRSNMHRLAKRLGIK